MHCRLVCKTCMNRTHRPGRSAKNAFLNPVTCELSYNFHSRSFAHVLKIRSEIQFSSPFMSCLNVVFLSVAVTADRGRLLVFQIDNSLFFLKHGVKIKFSSVTLFQYDYKA